MKIQVVEQLLKFVVREGQNEASQSGTTIGDNSESLYQMLQEYMVENQNLKEENENLKSERDDFSTRLEREQTTNEKITQEVRNIFKKIYFQRLKNGSKISSVYGTTGEEINFRLNKSVVFEE